MNVPLAMLSTPVLMTMLLTLQDQVQRPAPPKSETPKTMDWGLGAPSLFSMSLLMGGDDAPSKQPDHRGLAKAIVAELWDRGAWSLTPIDAARAVDAADELVKGHLA